MRRHMENKKKYKAIMGLIVTGIILFFLCIGFFTVKALMSDDSQKRKRMIQSVKLIKPPPPPKIKEKPPEPEIKKEEIIEPEIEEQKPPEDDLSDQDNNEPESSELGIDGEGSAGSDGFGLKAKKGGRALIGGGSGRSLLRKYSWYTRIIQEDINRLLKKILGQNKEIPGGNFKSFVRIKIDESGNILNCEIFKSSGNMRIDKAIRTAMRKTKISRPPPSGMPREMKLKICLQG